VTQSFKIRENSRMFEIFVYICRNLLLGKCLINAIVNWAVLLIIDSGSFTQSPPTVG